MGNLLIDRGEELREIVNAKLTALVLELEDADWPTEDIVDAIQGSLRSSWLDAIEAMRAARAATSRGFVPDGNEG